MVKKILNYSIVRLRRKPPTAGRTIVLGITGGIACGKSLITRFFRDLGAAVLSADELAREAVRPGEDVFQQIVAHFGEEILTTEGTIDRSRLARKIFLAPEERQQLNQITHPAIGHLADLRISELQKRREVPLIVYEAPLLFEAKGEERVDLVLVVASTPERQLERLMRRDNLSREEALQRISAQMPLSEKISRSDILIKNNGSPEETQKLIAGIYTQLTALKKNPPKSEDLPSF